ncbi:MULTISPECIES: DUF3857 domain-containing protein [Psychrilyobacter]|uniref:DUF3857 domain-containing protein n=1 Tax=Psychrilyobacter piezotolerans TaxID=2293438 RepID=A0ABX9KH48_9FUSO|nr:MULTISPECIES: DUF3857 domain-containing protein [Psychrilyobacter]MCS5421158.1 DUF3857 and transglutaminase domain-containing protein [Psychrilyobacter sp. S5]NDI77927.1 DUF3857 and transglutaminase domain-containing protein [Psychrilyobacter piezotolerans]RDE62043.1 DUF3857 domain-containing protein [Psychrilyobacter sp. S5]REI41290.1 DUF3857 domain-containing protein [Psychrilyobacter piezotolerans]
MKNKIKLFLCLTLTALIFIGCTKSKLENGENSDKIGYKFSEVIEIIKNNNKLPEEYNELGAVDLVNNKKTTVHEDGSSEVHYFYITQIINYEGKKKNSDIVINYDPTNEKLILGEMYTVTKDYKKISIPKNQSIEQDDELAIYSPTYVHNKNRIINFPQVEPGTYIVTDYTIKTKYTYPLGGNEPFDTKIPSVNKTRTIDYPKSMELKYEVAGDNIVEDKKVLGDRNILTFSSKNAKVLKREEEMPVNLLLDINKVVYSFYKDWSDLGKEKIQSMDNIEITPEVRELSNKIVGDTEEKIDKVAKIYSYVINNFTAQKIYLSQSDFKPLNLDRIIYQKYGSKIDLNALFVGLVRAQNINDVYPVIILDSYDKSSPYQIKYPMNNSIYTVGTYVEGRIVRLNSRGNYLDAFDEKTNYISKKNNYLPQVYEPKIDYKENKNYLYKLEDGDAKIDVNLEFKGIRDYFIRYYGEMLPAQRKNLIDQDFGSSSTTIVGETKFSDFLDYKEPMKMSYGLKADNFVIDQDKYLYFTIPSVEINLSLSLDKRDHDYQIYDEISTKETFRIDLGQKKNILKTSKFINGLNIIKEFKIGDRTAKYKFISKQDKNIIDITREIYIPVGIVKKEEYREFKDFVLDIKNPMRDKVFIKK